MTTSALNTTPATAWCPACGETHLRADGKCARCGAGVIKTLTQEGADVQMHRLPRDSVPHTLPAPVRTPPAVAPAPARVEIVELPPGKGSKHWYEETRALAEAFGNAADAAEGRAKDSIADAERYRRAANAFAGLLKQVSLAASSPSSTDQAASWSKRYDACIDCGTVERKHCANGRCRPCDDRWRHPRTTG